MPILRQIAQLGHPVLRAPVEAVDFPVTEAIQSLVADMLVTLRDANGVGIAAPQIYESKAIFIVASRPNPRYPTAPLMDPEVVINPEILERSTGDRQGLGRLSEHPRHPRRGAPAQRDQGPLSVDRGAVVERQFNDFVARIFQHEDDHLHGIVFLDRLESTRDLITEKEYQKRFIS